MANLKSNSKQDAFEKLRAEIEQARKIAGIPLRDVPLEDLEARSKKHKLGENANGWKNPYPADDPRNLLLEYQFAWREDKRRFKAGLMSRQTGKDFSSESEAAEDCHARPKTEWMIAAPSERQALDSLDQGKVWAEAFDLKIADYQEKREAGSETLLKSAEIIFSNGSRMRAVPGKPDTVRGRSANLLLTEFDFFENPSATWRAVLPSITNPLRGGEKKVRLITTPNGSGSAMHKIWTKEDSAKMKWSRHFVTIYHAVLMGLPVDIEQIREAFDDPDGFAQEFLCQFLDGSNVLLPYDIIAMAESADATEVWNFKDAGSSHPTFLGIDFGRTNDPTVCWTLQQVGDVLWTREILVLRNISSPDQEQILKDRIRASRRTCFDYTGPGIGLGDYLVDTKRGGVSEWKPKEHKLGKLELCTFTTGFKRELFPNLRTAFKDPKGVCRLRIPISTAIREDLHAMQQVVTNGEYNYWSRRTREGHSDRCTALALAVRAAGGISAGAIDAETLRKIKAGADRHSSPRRFIPRRLAI
jgi:phage FluMu gp28-like protein